FLGQPGPDPDLLWVDGDNVAGAQAAVEHLIRVGCRRIACLAGSPELVSAQHRLLGYKNALAQAHVPFSPDWVIPADFTEAGGYQATRALLDRLAEPPDGIFASNDLMAIGSLRALREAGLSVPQQVAVAGFDGIPMGEFSVPRLTTVEQPIYQMGQSAAELLLSALQGEEPACRQIRYPLQLRIRESTARAAPPFEGGDGPGEQVGGRGVSASRT
ncbi:MAG: substrate-binding domain-containing protein, partial [Firmicutes bacterium]|nr:substrate-binding domain-containing protein [Bacillota bacterium]